jgi:hypothetical protein
MKLKAFESVFSIDTTSARSLKLFVILGEVAESFSPPCPSHKPPFSRH